MRRYGGGILYATLPLHMQKGCFRIRTHDQQVTKTQLYRCIQAVILNNYFWQNFRGRLKSPWSRRKRKHVLTPQQWKSVFTQDGGIRDGGIKFMKRVRSGVTLII